MQSMPRPKVEDLRAHFESVKNTQDPVILRLCELIRRAQDETGNDRAEVQEHAERPEGCRL
jgi:hypothetical protein